MLTLILVLFIRQVGGQIRFAEALLNTLPPPLRQGPVERPQCKEVLSVTGPLSGMVTRACKLTAAGGTSGALSAGVQGTGRLVNSFAAEVAAS